MCERDTAGSRAFFQTFMGKKKKKTEVYKQKAISRINSAHCREHLHEIPLMSSFEEASVI